MKKHFRDIPIEDRPREKLKNRGAVQLTSQELMQILLGSGTKEKDVKRLADEIWSVLERRNYRATHEDLRNIHGLGDAKISKILSCVELAVRMRGGWENLDDIKPERVWEALADLRASKKEHFIILYLDSRNREIDREVVSIGTINASIVHPREVFSKAVERSAACIIGAHNHPSNVCEPSDADLAVTKRLVEAGDILGISFADHVIITQDDYYSIREHHDHLFD